MGVTWWPCFSSDSGIHIKKDGKMAALFPCLAAGERSSRRKETPMRKEHNYGQQQQQRPWASVVLLAFFNGKRMRHLGNEDAANEHVRAREWMSHTEVTVIHCAYTTTDILRYWLAWFDKQIRVKSRVWRWTTNTGGLTHVARRPQCGCFRHEKMLTHYVNCYNCRIINAFSLAE